MEYSGYLDFVTDLAYRAGKQTLVHFNTGIRPEFKPDHTPVTAADKAAEEMIRAEIERVYPGHAIVGEEYGEKAGEGNPFRWIIDPIDGTKSFMRGVPLYAVLIGLEVEGEVRVGAAYFPGLDEMLCASEGGGAWWNSRRARVSRVATLNEAVFCYGSWMGFEKRGCLDVWERLNHTCFFGRGWSDSYAYLLAATGRTEIAIDPVMNVWDCGPFPVIFREAGGYFGSWTGEEGHLHGEAVACSAALKPEVLKLMRGEG
jgi:histidinol-phosphatase